MTTHHAATRTSPLPVRPSTGTLRPLGLDEVRITDGFWARRQEVNRHRTLDHIEHWLEREGWLGNFDLAASGILPEGRRGREFADSEVFKYLEALAWELGRDEDPDLEKRLRDITTRVGSAQESDGYLHTNFGRPGQGERWSDLEWGHELYCFGHLFQAAVARERTAPGADDGLLGIALRVADLVCEEFGPEGRDAVCGHAEIETALAELGRLVGDQRYLDQARLFVERRGRGTLAPIEFGQEYFQDDVPVREATVLRGHAVRANYLASGATDVAVDGGDVQLLDALEEQWEATAGRRTYITGGQGSHHQDEAFGQDYELPPDRAYSETCAGIASIQFSWRLLLARGLRAEYADLMERTLYNVVATSPDEDGTAFYYANTLHQRVPGHPADPEIASARASSSLRAPWFAVSCCPTNVARTLASLAGYLATADASGVQIHQHMPARIRTVLPEAGPVSLRVETTYPATGSVSVHIDQAPAREITLALRVPSWADGATLRVHSAAEVAGERPAEIGYVHVSGVFAAGDRIELTLPMAPRTTHPDRRIDAVRGCVAVERGPVVYALESVDLPDGCDVSAARIDLAQPVREDGGEVIVPVRIGADGDGTWPYSSTPGPGPADALVEARLTPYHAWAERGPSTMRIWIPTA